MKYDIYKNEKGGTIILVTMLILTSIITVTLAAAEIIRINLTMGRTQVYSTTAYFAAEAGAEKILYDVRNATPIFGIESCSDGSFVCLDANGSSDACILSLPCVPPLNEFITLSNNANYKIIYQTPNAGIDNIIRILGSFNNLQRVIELKY